MNTFYKCPKCKQKTTTEKQFCEHCLFNVTRYYKGSGPAIRTGIPWDYKIKWDDSPQVQRQKTEAIVAEKKQWTSMSNKYAKWEKGRRKRLSERRDYFRSHPDKEDDFSGV